MSSARRDSKALRAVSRQASQEALRLKVPLGAKGSSVLGQFDRPLQWARKGRSPCHRALRRAYGSCCYWPRPLKDAHGCCFREVASAFCFSCSFFFHLCSCRAPSAVKRSAQGTGAGMRTCTRGRQVGWSLSNAVREDLKVPHGPYGHRRAHHGLVCRA